MLGTLDEEGWSRSAVFTATTQRDATVLSYATRIADHEVSHLGTIATDYSMNTVVNCLIDLALGLFVLIVANALLEPVPFVVALSEAVGLLLFCVTSSRRRRRTLVGFMVGALIGSGTPLHRTQQSAD